MEFYDTETAPLAPPAPGPDILAARTADGSFNDLAKPWMGMARARFGRNAAVNDTFGEAAPGLYEPNPRVVSNDLLARRTFIPAESVNVFLAGWLQFMVHDWLSHGVNPKENPHLLPRPPGDDWPQATVSVLRTGTDPIVGPADTGRPATFRNSATHWWDGSQIYGSDLDTQKRTRSDPKSGTLLADGKLWLDADGHLPRDSLATDPDQEFAAVNGNWWIGLSAMHTLFTREHNAVVDRLHGEYPDKDGEWLFQKARLITAALIIKIHATEWTPALLQSPSLQYAMRGSWWGILGEDYARAHGRPARSEVLSGIPASPQEHHAAPYAITEEFTSVYRLHSLMPDDFSIRRHSDDAGLAQCTLGDLFGGGTRRLYDTVPFADVLYSLATSFAGAPVLHNYPTHLRRIPEKPEANLFNDLASIDVLRDRERGVPRYCAFRRMLRMSVPKSFAELTDNPTWQRARGDLRQRRARRSPHRRPRGDQARRLRHIRYRLPDLHPDGRTAAQERPLPDRLLYATSLYAGGHRLGRKQRHARSVLRHEPCWRRGPGCPQHVLSLAAGRELTMARRIRVPGLVDVILVSEPAEIFALNDEPRLDRRFAAAGRSQTASSPGASGAVPGQWPAPPFAVAPRRCGSRRSPEEPCGGARSGGGRPLAAAHSRAARQLCPRRLDARGTAIEAQEIVGRNFFAEFDAERRVGRRRRWSTIFATASR